MVSATILTSPDPQVWRLLGLPVPGEPEAPADPPEGGAPDSGEVGDFLL